jgi:hypothetical protein
MKLARQFVYLSLLFGVGASMRALNILKRLEARKKLSGAHAASNDPASKIDSCLDDGSSNKIDANCYKGISYLSIVQLPAHQRQHILKWNALKTIKIKTESTILTDCIPYNEYETWYNEKYRQLATLSEDR